MPLRVIVHMHNEDPFLAEVDDLPDPKDNFILLRNPRKRDGKQLTFVTEGATEFIYPWTRITFVEVMDRGGSSAREQIVGLFREDTPSSRL